MIQITTQEFQQLREAIACGHIFMQSLRPLFARVDPRADKQQRELLKRAPEEFQRAFTLLATITQRELGDPSDPETRPTIRIQDIDFKSLRNDIENVSALAMPDLRYEMACALGELPGINVLCHDPEHPTENEAWLAAIIWEAGRRYGVAQAIAILDATTTEFAQGTIALLEHALNLTLELPPPELPLPPGRADPENPGPRSEPGPTLVN
jgi:hypothetical protein